MTEIVEQALATLSALHPKKIDLGLGRIERVLGALGNPHHRLPPTVHVAGTNGKGSTIALLRAMCQAQGLKTHVYSSPHLVRFHERIVLANSEISDAYLVDVLTRVRRANAEAALSFFEATTAAMFLAFSETPADIALIEVGLGGRYDATNVITPTCTAVTPVDYDHAEFLGRDLAGIAREKAGIFKKNTPAFIGAQAQDIARDVLESEAHRNGLTPKIQGQDFRTYCEHDRLIFEDERALLDLPLPALLGYHQIENAGLAIAVARTMQISDTAIAKGLETARWPARLQKLTSGPLVESLAEIGAELWLDGGHNPHAARAVANTMAGLEAENSRPLILITGILSNKDIGGFLDAFEGLARAVIGVPIEGHTALAPETLQELAQNRGLMGAVAQDMMQAVDLALEYAQDDCETPPRILICGSLYLAGEVLAENG